MEDTRLHALRRDPSPEFAEQLRVRLRQYSGESARSSDRWPVRRVTTGVAAVAAVALLFLLPEMRASAQSFLAMFRVVNFVALPVDPDRLASLQSQQLDVPQLIGERLEVLENAGPATAAVSPEQAGAAAGIDVRQPASLPPDVTLVGITVKGQHRARVTADAARLQQVMDVLGIQDLEVPDGLDGQVVNVRIPPVVTMVYDYSQGRRSANFVQAATPEVLLPSGIDLRVLGEIGLRILGLPAAEARQFAGAMDWQTTLLVPVPPGATSFRQVDINGARGVAIERSLTTNGASGALQRANIMLWSSNGRVFGIEGTFTSEQMVQMARSVR